MRSTRATAAVARLNRRAEGRHYLMVITGDNLFKLREQLDGAFVELTEALALDDFVKLVDATRAPAPRRVSKYDAAFAKQLIKKAG